MAAQRARASAAALVGSKCWLKQFSDTPCSGRLVRVHLVPYRLVTEKLTFDGLDGVKVPPAEIAAHAMDSRIWVPGCGGPTGIGGHHGELDHSRTLEIPRDRLPEGVEIFAQEVGLEAWLDREYGQPEARENAA